LKATAFASWRHCILGETEGRSGEAESKVWVSEERHHLVSYLNRIIASFFRQDFSCGRLNAVLTWLRLDAALSDWAAVGIASSLFILAMAYPTCFRCRLSCFPS
jgi:hypothetical protein